ncbi:MAG TPA: DUF3891 family protein [Gaiellaceae bacterium]|nr:DUF3891 family protein [Gaiellaceae bacterium]
MIVRDAGDCWQIVYQTDHAALSGAFARTWADRGPRHDALTVAAYRHDDGWAVWERAPTIDGDARPVTFVDVPIPIHVAFYRAMIAAVANDDPYAGLLVSMHGVGIYKQRFGTDSMLKESHEPPVQAVVEAFVAEQEAGWPERRAALGASEDESFADYFRLQMYDRLSLYFCMRDVDAGEAAEITDWRIEPLAPWRVSLDPFPFAESPARFELERYVLPKRRWMRGEFRTELAATEPQRTELTIEPAK